MDNIRRLTDTINTFVRFFQSVNCLFWNVQWLEENLTKASNPRMLIVGIISLFCVFYTFMADSVKGTDPMVYVIVGCVIIWVLYRRYQTRIIEGRPVAAASQNSGGSSVGTEEEEGALIQHGIVIEDYDMEHGTQIPSRGKW